MMLASSGATASPRRTRLRVVSRIEPKTKASADQSTARHAADLCLVAPNTTRARAAMSTSVRRKPGQREAGTQARERGHQGRRHQPGPGRALEQPQGPRHSHQGGPGHERVERDQPAHHHDGGADAGQVHGAEAPHPPVAPGRGHGRVPGPGAGLLPLWW